MSRYTDPYGYCGRAVDSYFAQGFGTATPSIPMSNYCPQQRPTTVMTRFINSRTGELESVGFHTEYVNRPVYHQPPVCYQPPVYQPQIYQQVYPRPTLNTGMPHQIFYFN